MIIRNSIMLIALNIAKIIFPFLTLPYLTRVLSTDSYGTVAYVKAVMGYMQIFIDFGFMLSGTKQIVEANNDKTKISKIVACVTACRIGLACCGIMIVLLLCFIIPLLRMNFLFVVLSYFVVVLSVFLFDFLFRGIEKMEIITIRFVVMKGVSTILTFVFVRDDSDLLWIPILDLIGSAIAIAGILLKVKKMQLRLTKPDVKMCMENLKTSFIYFISSVASTSFNAFNTIVLGIALTSSDIAYWSICIQIMSAVQMLYTPIGDALYPEMVKNRNPLVIKKVLKILLPVLLAGCIAVYIFGDLALYIAGGEKYVAAFPVLRLLIPVIFFGFLSIIFGWPVLGALGMERQTTKSTICSVLFQLSMILLLLVTKKLTLITAAIIRSLTEILLFGIRIQYCVRFLKGEKLI